MNVNTAGDVHTYKWLICVNAAGRPHHHTQMEKHFEMCASVVCGHVHVSGQKDGHMTTLSCSLTHHISSHFATMATQTQLTCWCMWPLVTVLTVVSCYQVGLLPSQCYSINTTCTCCLYTWLSVHLAVCTPTYTPVSTPSFMRTWLCAHLPLHPSYSCLYTCLYNELWRHLWVDFWLPWRWRWLLLFVLLLSSCQCTYQRAGCASRLCWLFPNFTRFYLWLSVFDRLTLYWQQIKCQQKLHFMLSFIGCKW